MGTFDQYPDRYIDANEKQTKQLNIVVCIEGMDVCYSLLPSYTRVRYGDPDIKYGDPGLVYGGLRLLSGIKASLDPNTNLTVSQRLEPEQGRGAVGTLSLSFIDFSEEFTQLVSPGQVLDEVLGGKLVKVFLGYQDSSYPDDYFKVFQGYISQTQYVGGKWTLQLSDPNIKRRQYLFNQSTTKLSLAIDASTTSIPVLSADDFSDHILGPDMTYDTSIKTYIRIDDEIMEYGPGDLSPNLITVTRGSRGTIPASHDVDADVSGNWELSGNIIDIGLKLMLSGWNGNYASDIQVLSLVNTYDSDLGFIDNAIRMPLGVNLNEEYNPVAGDYVTISGSTMGNDGTYRILSLGDAQDYKNNIMYIDGTLTAEYPAPSVRLAIRSQYDTLPINCGLKMRPQEIDMQTIVDLRNTYLTTAENQMRFFIKERATGKEFIESQLLLPIGAYALTRYGRCSMSITLPPIAGVKLPKIDKDTVIDPQNIQVSRGLNNRRFFNEIAYSFDQRDDGEYSQVTRFLDTKSLSKVTISSVLPIKADGIRSDLAAETLLARRGQFLLNRYKDAAYEITCKVNWKVGSLIEAGDVVIFDDSGYLQVPNLETGERNLGVQLLEVLDRSMDIKSGTVQLKLLSSLGYSINDRFATISPSSLIEASESSTTKLKLKPSFGEAFGSDEFRKWDVFVGLPIVIHDYNWTVEYERVFLGFDGSQDNTMLIDDPLPISPSEDWIVDIARYPETDTLKSTNALYKVSFCHLDPTLTVTNGISQTQFEVSLSDAAKLTVGLPIFIRNNSWSIESEEVLVDDVTGTVVTVDSLLGIVPVAGQKVELVGFKDGGGPYRII